MHGSALGSRTRTHSWQRCGNLRRGMLPCAFPALQTKATADDERIRNRVVISGERELNRRLQREPVVEEDESETEVRDAGVVGERLLSERGIGDVGRGVLEAQ